jgi:acyl-homoserine lactone acylase PvdQ
MIVDFGNLENNRSVLPGGVSGLSTLGAPYDQFELFVSGNYHNEYFTADTPEKLRDRCRSVTSTVVFVTRQEG